jgi:uncharacterized protein YciI
MRFVVIFEDVQEMVAVRETLEPDHLAYLETHRTEILMAGGCATNTVGPTLAVSGFLKCLTRPVRLN